MYRENLALIVPRSLDACLLHPHLKQRSSSNWDVARDVFLQGCGLAVLAVLICQEHLLSISSPRRY